MDIETRVLHQVQECLCLESLPAPHDRLAADLAADSHDFIELAMGIEDEFAIEVSDDAIEKWATVADVIAFVKLVTA